MYIHTAAAAAATVRTEVAAAATVYKQASKQAALSSWCMYVRTTAAAAAACREQLAFIILLGLCSFPAYVMLILCSNSTLVFHLKNRFFPLSIQLKLSSFQVSYPPLVLAGYLRYHVPIAKYVCLITRVPTKYLLFVLS